MFSGKTEELLRRLRRAQIANQHVEIFKPSIDVRYDAVSVVSHDANAVPAIVARSSREILDMVNNADVVCIDEAQFFDDEITEVCQNLASDGVRVIISGLDMDYRGKPFGAMPNLLAVAEYITKLHAICVHCGSLATHSYRISTDTDTVVVGEKDKYEPRCRTCFSMGNVLDLPTHGKKMRRD